MVRRNLLYAVPMSKSVTPRRLSNSSVEAAALHYLERFAASAEALRRVLLRRVEHAARLRGEDAAEGRAMVDALIARYLASGLLDDRRYAEAKGRSILRQGGSIRAIRCRLAAKGVAPETIEAALGDLRDEQAGSIDELDLAAAVALARRRRLGPYRPADQRVSARDRDLAALGRAGFSWEIARRVIDGQAG